MDQRRGPSRTPTPVLLPLPVGAAARTQGQQQQHAPDERQAGAGGSAREEETRAAAAGGRPGDNGGAPRAGRPTVGAPFRRRASRRNAGGAAFNGFRGSGKPDLL
ncbi:hypothetical protein GQ55_5G089000 [Panicum hallii var. hallii]|uniref:Uncharacterized protein n=1 Tax=Panicum hallii var. hallii TaxID=1504633 RepID=A0A2T7DEC2_9POAL|nr:hypothetical protein GQ55_5G089000 [Panicum hallii var. hallii]